MEDSEPPAASPVPSELALHRDLLRDIKSRVRSAQTRAASAANAELLAMYWDIGQLIEARQLAQAWGQGTIRKLASALRNELPEQKGFSETNLKRMVRFWREYPDLFVYQTEQSSAGAALPIGPPPMVQLTKQSANKSATDPQRVLAPGLGQPALHQELIQLSWTYHVILLEMVRDRPIRLWYGQQTARNGWTAAELKAQIKSQAHLRHGTAVNNFDRTLPVPHADLARQLLKDPYVFDFLTIDTTFRERELELGLLAHLEKFLLELGRGFAFVGRQYRLQVGDGEYFVDLLFYHLELRCFIVVELKTGDFKPEYAGKMNFYCSVVDDRLRRANDAPTLGLILCQTKDRIIAEYALRDIHKPIGVADYELTRALPSSLASSLPSIAAIEAELSETLGEQES